MKLPDDDRNRLIRDVEEQITIAQNALQKIAELADGKDGNVIFLALCRKKDLDVILKCVKINK